MADSQDLTPIRIAAQAERLTQPFTMIDLAQIDDLMLSLYLCQGTMPDHRHLDQDELFLVFSGTITLDSQWGPAVLRPGELTVVPKGLAHRSSSLLRSLVLLLQPRLMVNRRNGDRRLFTLPKDGRLEKVSIPAMGRQIAVAFVPIALAHVDTFAFNAVLCRDAGPWWTAEDQASLVLCHEGRVTVDSELGRVALADGELTVVPKGVPYRLVSAGGALVTGVQRHKQRGSTD